MPRLTWDRLLGAYAVGWFPMARGRHDPRIEWMEPRQRGILPLDSFHVPRSLARTVRRGRFEQRVDHDFAGIINACAEPVPGRAETWLNDELIGLYVELHARGFAHSVETWRDGRLVGGLYGVSLRGAFFGESMFSRESDASKVALVELVGRLRAGGFQLLDTQYLTPHLEQFGTVELRRGEYARRLEQALQVETAFPTGPLPGVEPGPGVRG